MPGNASKYCWPHRKQELKARIVPCKAIISQYYIHFSICEKSGGGAKAPAAPPAPASPRKGKVLRYVNKRKVFSFAYDFLRFCLCAQGNSN